MFRMLVSLAISLKPIRKIRTSRAMASALTLALISIFFLTSCIGSIKPSEWGDMFATIGKVIGLIPDDADVKTPMQYVVDKFGEDFGQKFERWIIKIAELPPLNKSWLGLFNKGVAGISLILVGVFSFSYWKKLQNAVEDFGSDVVESGGTDVIPPDKYWQKRLFPVLSIILGGLIFLQILLNLAQNIIISIAKAFYVERGETIGTLTYNIVSQMLDGANIWAIAILVVIILPLVLFALSFYVVRYFMIELQYVSMMFQVPTFLSGTKHDKLAIPIHLLIKRVLIFLTSQLTLLSFALIVDITGLTGIPVAVGLVLTLILTIALPIVLFWWYKPAAMLVAEKTMGWVDDIDVYPISTELQLPGRHYPKVDRWWDRTFQRVGDAATRLVRQTDPSGYETARQMAAVTRSVRRTPTPKAVPPSTPSPAPSPGSEVPPTPTSPPAPSPTPGTVATSTPRATPTPILSTPLSISPSGKIQIPDDIDEMVDIALAAGLHQTHHQFDDKTLYLFTVLKGANMAGSDDEIEATAKEMFRKTLGKDDEGKTDKKRRKEERDFLIRRSQRLRRQLKEHEVIA